MEVIVLWSQLLKVQHIFIILVYIWFQSIFAPSNKKTFFCTGDSTINLSSMFWNVCFILLLVPKRFGRKGCFSNIKFPFPTNGELEIFLVRRNQLFFDLYTSFWSFWFSNLSRRLWQPGCLRERKIDKKIDRKTFWSSSWRHRWCHHYESCYI